jgi:hypothetical protein
MEIIAYSVLAYQVFQIGGEIRTFIAALFFD